jgi:dihydropteroate synthase
MSSPTVGVRVYLRPLGVLHGEAAGEALAGGWALPLGGGRGAFTACEIWRRSGERIERASLPVGGLEGWAHNAGDALATALEQRLGRLNQPQSLPAGLPERGPLIMGVVNVTPDSFSDGGRFLDSARAIAEGRAQHAAGADIVDVGGESTRPGAADVSAEEEIRRVVPVVEALAQSGILVSIDTRKASVMGAAVAAGAGMINDVSALRHDTDSLRTAGASGLPVVLMHSQGEPATMQRDPRYGCVPLDVFDHLERRIEAWVEAGFERRRLLVDPGIGFGKTLAHNVAILRTLGLYLGLGSPLLLGVSRKSFIARLADDGSAAAERLPGSLAAALAGLAQGVAVLRVHDVAATRQALRIWQALCS